MTQMFVPFDKNGFTLGIQSPCQMMIRVANHLLSIVFRFHYHSQKVIGSLGSWILRYFPTLIRPSKNPAGASLGEVVPAAAGTSGGGLLTFVV